MSSVESTEAVGAFDLVGEDMVALEAGGIVSVNPAHPEDTVWSAKPMVDHVAAAVDMAWGALGGWRRAGLEKRIEGVSRF